MSKWKRTVDKIAYLLRSRQEVAIGGDNAIDQIFHWLGMQDESISELNQKINRQIFPFRCPDCSVEFMSQEDVDLHRVENHWQDIKSQETICDEHKAKYFESGYEAGQTDRYEVTNGDEEVIVVYDSRNRTVSFHTGGLGIDPRKGAPDTRGVVPSMDDWAAARSVPIVDDPLYGPPIVPGLRCGCGASMAHELPVDKEVHRLWAGLVEPLTPPVDRVNGNDQITIELACRRVLDYMTGHFSSGSIEGVLAALRGHSR